MFVFKLPEIGEGVVEGEIVRWLAAVGDQVQVDQPLCEVMTDKATVEISSPRSGRVAAIHGSEGDIVQVHSPLVDIDENGASDSPAPTAATPAPPPKTEAAPKAPRAAPAPRAPAPAPAPQAPTPAAPRTPPSSGGKALASPAVRNYARSRGVDINQLTGTGKDGRIQRSDVNSFGSRPELAAAAVAPPALQLPQGPAFPHADERVRIIGLRRKIAEKMVDEVDVTRLADLLQGLKAVTRPAGIRLTYLPFIMKALVDTFRDFPSINANMDEESFELLVRGEVNIGIATDTEAGLFVPVIRNVEQKSILQLAQEISGLVERTRAGTVALDELQGGTFTITSVGNIGGRFATPIINHPEVAILGVNQAHDRPMAVDGQVVVRKMMYLSPSFDHRVIDGAVAARFVAALKARLELPESLLLELR
ncbi:MAG: dihydrolipoamide acetyltransferase family protein [Myxococcota bacterium]|nr:dihydrolipoamide acetyltransferase family protein [Myxococcota bacterium]